MNSTGPEQQQEREELVRVRQLLTDAGAYLEKYEELAKAKLLQEAGQACASATESYLQAHEQLIRLSNEDPLNVKLSIDVGASYIKLAEAFWTCKGDGPTANKVGSLKITQSYIKEGTSYADASREWTEQALGFFERLIREHASDSRYRRELFQACMDVYHHLADGHFRRQALPLHWANTLFEQGDEPLLIECRIELAKEFLYITNRVGWYWAFDKGRGGLSYAEDPKQEMELQRLDYDYLRELLKAAIALMVPVVKEQPGAEEFMDQLQRELRGWQ